MSDRKHSIDRLALLTAELDALDNRLRNYFNLQNLQAQIKAVHVEVEIENQKFDGVLHSKRERVTVKFDDNAHIVCAIVNDARQALLKQRDAKQVEINAQLQIVAEVCEAKKEEVEA